MTPELYFEVARSARVDHRCEVCRQAIVPGTNYLDVSGLTDGRWWRAALHQWCGELSRLVWEQQELGGLAFEGIALADVLELADELELLCLLP